MLELAEAVSADNGCEVSRVECWSRECEILTTPEQREDYMVVLRTW